MRMLVALIAGMVIWATIPATAGARLYDGVYMAKFPQGDCGTLTISGKRMSYKSGRCGGSTVFSSSASYKNQVVTIQRARFAVRSASENSISGSWSFGPLNTSLVFRRIK